MAGQFLTQTLLEFSEDDLNDATPTWQDVTADCQGIEWWAGIDSEGDDPQPGGAVIRMKNTGRRWEPDYVAGQFYPNIVYGRRFRLTLDDAVGAAVQEGLWYITNIAIEYPAGTGYSEVVFTCADGCEVLALDDLPQLDPPDAQTYADVVEFHEPWGYWRLGEQAGTRVVSQVRRKWRGKGRHRRKVKTRTFRTVPLDESAAVSGPTGTYLGNPLLGQPGAIVGDTDTCALFGAVNQQMVFTVEGDDALSSRNAVSVTAWVYAEAWATSLFIVNGPQSGGNPLFSLSNEAPGLDGLAFRVNTGAGLTGNATGVASPTDEWLFLAGTFDGMMVRLYVNGVLEVETGYVGQLPAITSPQEMQFMDEIGGNGSVYLDEVSICEHVLSADTIASLYTAGSARGFPQQTAGERIAEIATHALWSEASIQTSGRDVMPQMMFGQSRIEEIAELAHAEGPRTMFFFNGNGDPVYLGHEWQATSSSYNTTQVTLGDQLGEVAYEGIEPVYDNEVYNEVTVSHEAGLAATVGTGTPPPRRANTDYTDVLLMEHAEVESLAYAILAFYEDPQFRFESVTLNGATADCLNHILRRDIGHQVRVKKSGESGARIDRISNIIGKRKALTRDKHLTCRWNLSRGFNAADGLWHAGIVGDSEAGVTTVAA